MVFDPFVGRPEFIEVTDFFDDSAISSSVWGTKVEVGNTTIAEAGGYLVFNNPGTGVLGESYIPSFQLFPRYIRISVDIALATGSAPADGNHADAYIELYKDTDNWIKFGPYRDTAAGINSIGYMRALQAGVADTLVVAATACDADIHTFTLILLEDMVLVYFDSVYYTSFEWTDLVDYSIRLGAATTANADKIVANFDYFEVQSSFDFALMQIGFDVDYIKYMLDSSPLITDGDYTMLDSSFSLNSTTAQTVEFLAATYGRVFRLSATFNITGAKIDYCRLYDSSLGTFLNQDSEAADLADGNVYIVPSPGPGLNDYIAFGCNASTKRLDIVLGPGGRINKGNTFVWRKMNGAGGQVAFTALTDGTTGFTGDGSVTWTDNLVLDTINGVQAYWVIAKISVAGAATDIPLGSHMQFSPTANTDFDSRGVFGSFLKLFVYRKVGGSYRQQPVDIMYFQQSNLRKDVGLDLLCYSDTKLVFQLESTPASAITVPYSGVVITEKV